MEKPIEYWHEMYMLRANTSAFKKKVEKAQTVVYDFFHAIDEAVPNIVTQCRAMWSGGKDSTAMLHLIASIFYDNRLPIRAVTEKDTMDFPGELEYIKTISEMFRYKVDILSPEKDPWEYIKEIDFSDDIHSRGIKFANDFFYNLIRDYKQANNVGAVLLGLRAEESKARRMNFLKNGYWYYCKRDNEFVCQPLADWSASDVFAYLFSRNIPIFDVYFKTAFVDSPEQIRKSWILPSARTNQGQAVFLKYYYPEIFDSLAAIMTRLKQYI